MFCGKGPSGRTPATRRATAEVVRTRIGDPDSDGQGGRLGVRRSERHRYLPDQVVVPHGVPPRNTGLVVGVSFLVQSPVLGSQDTDSVYIVDGVGGRTIPQPCRTLHGQTSTEVLPPVVAKD